MGATVAAVSEFFAVAAPEAAVVDVAATAGVMGGTAASGAGAGLLEAGAAAATAEYGIGTVAALGGKALAEASGYAAISSLLAPKRPDLPKPLPMPDPLAQDAARKKALIEQIGRSGRASTVLTVDGGNASGKLGG